MDKKKKRVSRSQTFADKGNICKKLYKEKYQIMKWDRWRKNSKQEVKSN